VDVRAAGSFVDVKRLELDKVRPVKDKQQGRTQEEASMHTVTEVDGRAQKRHYREEKEAEYRDESESSWVDTDARVEATDGHPHGEQHTLDVIV
jgi:hypothetical protein